MLATALSALAAEPPAFRADPEIVKAVGSVAAERIQRSIFVLVSFKTRHTLSDPQPSGDGIGGASAWIRAEFERASHAARGRLQVDFDTFRQAKQPPLVPNAVDLTNVVATLPGASKRTYVITAHYDSRAHDLADTEGAAPGADDNAAGVAAVLEAARDLAPLDFNATLVFLITTGGEQGGLGAAHWAEEARKQGLDVAGVVDVDAVGRTRQPDGTSRRGFRLFAQGVPKLGDETGYVRALVEAGGENDTPPRMLARAIQSAVLLYAPAADLRVVYRSAPHPARGGPLPFLTRGFPAVGLTSAEDSADHGDDMPDALDFAHVADAARIEAALLAALGRAPEAPRAVVVAAGPSGAELSWAPGTEATAYRVVWRETTAPFWEHGLAVPAGAVRAVVPGVSAATTIFGLQAVDGSDHASPVTFALPAVAN